MATATAALVGAQPDFERGMGHSEACLRLPFEPPVPRSSMNLPAPRSSLPGVGRRTSCAGYQPTSTSGGPVSGTLDHGKALAVEAKILGVAAKPSVEAANCRSKVVTNFLLGHAHGSMARSDSRTSLAAARAQRAFTSESGLPPTRTSGRFGRMGSPSPVLGASPFAPPWAGGEAPDVAGGAHAGLLQPQPTAQSSLHSPASCSLENHPSFGLLRAQSVFSEVDNNHADSSNNASNRFAKGIALSLTEGAGAGAGAPQLLPSPTGGFAAPALGGGVLSSLPPRPASRGGAQSPRGPTREREREREPTRPPNESLPVLSRAADPARPGSAAQRRTSDTISVKAVLAACAPGAPSSLKEDRVAALDARTDGKAADRVAEWLSGAGDA